MASESARPNHNDNAGTLARNANWSRNSKRHTREQQDTRPEVDRSRKHRLDKSGIRSSANDALDLGGLRDLDVAAGLGRQIHDHRACADGMKTWGKAKSQHSGTKREGDTAAARATRHSGDVAASQESSEQHPGTLA